MAERVAVVGGGVGGLSAASGCGRRTRVTVFERNEVVGGKLAAYERDGYIFDIGPSLVTWPAVFDEVFRAVGTSLDDRSTSSGSTPVPLPLATARRSRFPTATTRPPRVRGLRPGAGGQWRVRRTRKRIWDVIDADVLRRADVESVVVGKADAVPVRSDRDRSDANAAPLSASHSSTTLASSSGPTATPPTRVRRRTRRRPRSPASRTSRLPTAAGTRWADSTRSAPRSTGRGRRGVEIRTATEVASIIATAGVGGRACRGDHRRADIVVANTDAEHLYGDLLPDPTPSSGTPGQTVDEWVRAVRGRAGTDAEDPAPQRVVLRELPGRVDQLEAGQLADDPTIYACVSSVTDPSQAPPAARTGSCSSTPRRRCGRRRRVRRPRPRPPR